MNSLRTTTCKFIEDSHTTTSDLIYSESTSILIHARTDNQVGYAFVNVSHPYDANRAVLNLHGKFVRGRRVSIQLARILDEPQQSTHELVDLTRKRKLDDSLRDCL